MCVLMPIQTYYLRPLHPYLLGINQCPCLFIYAFVLSSVIPNVTSFLGIDFCVIPNVTSPFLLPLSLFCQCHICYPHLIELISLVNQAMPLITSCNSLYCSQIIYYLLYYLPCYPRCHHIPFVKLPIVVFANRM